MTTQIIISDYAIHQDAEGRYSLNDLHKASGGEQRHQPRYWLAIQQTKELIEVVINSEISLFQPVESKRGRSGGTYVCKELVYAYAMWISASFSLKVIRAYDAMLSPAVPATAGAHRVLISFNDAHQPITSRIVRPDEHLATTEIFAEILKRLGFVVTHCSELEQLTVAELSRRALVARQAQEKWADIK